MIDLGAPGDGWRDTIVVVGLALLVLGAVAAAVGAHARREQGSRRRVATLAAVAGVVAAVVVLIAGPEPEVPTGRFLLGVACGALLYGVVPTVAYASLGRALALRAAWLVVAWVASLVLLAVYVGIATYVVGHWTVCVESDGFCPTAW